MESTQPLVSIMIPNYNHSKYLDECIQSALNQTYKNIEIVVLDNSSDDNSVEIVSKYISNVVRVCRNTYNIFNTSYKVLDVLSGGKYKMMLCADDYIESDFVENAVKIMEKYPNVGYVHAERDFITDSGELLELDPFFNCSFISKGIDIMPLYMVTTIGHPSQGIFRTEVFNKIGGYDMEIDHMNADRMLWFYLSNESDYAYIRKKSSRIRVGNQTETFVTQRNFQHPILCHLTIKEMVDFAKRNNIPGVYKREDEALERLSREFLNYAAGMLANNEYDVAGQYLKYACVINENISENEVYIKLENMQMGITDVDIEYLKKITKVALQKKRGYNPPENYEEIYLEEL